MHEIWWRTSENVTLFSPFPGLLLTSLTFHLWTKYKQPCWWLKRIQINCCGEQSHFKMRNTTEISYFWRVFAFKCLIESYIKLPQMNSARSFLLSSEGIKRIITNILLIINHYPVIMHFVPKDNVSDTTGSTWTK